jgi:hypothetical protein
MQAYPGTPQLLDSGTLPLKEVHPQAFPPPNATENMLRDEIEAAAQDVYDPFESLPGVSRVQSFSNCNVLAPGDLDTRLHHTQSSGATTSHEPSGCPCQQIAYTDDTPTVFPTKEDHTLPCVGQHDGHCQPQESLKLSESSPSLPYTMESQYIMIPYDDESVSSHWSDDMP